MSDGVSDDQRLAQAEQLLKEARAALRAAKGDGATVTPRSVDEAIEVIDIYFHYYFPNLTTPRPSRPLREEGDAPRQPRDPDT